MNTKKYSVKELKNKDLLKINGGSEPAYWIAYCLGMITNAFVYACDWDGTLTSPNDDGTSMPYGPKW